MKREKSKMAKAGYGYGKELALVKNMYIQSWRERPGNHGLTFSNLPHLGECLLSFGKRRIWVSEKVRLVIAGSKATSTYFRPGLHWDLARQSS